MKFLHNINRVEAFSDAVFAFAATLMVVSLGTGDSSLEFRDNWVGFISFGVSFFVLVALWKVHYNYFRRTTYLDNWTIAFNAILLFVVLYFVFPLKSLANSWFSQAGISMDDLASLFQLYSLGFLLIFLCFSLMYWRAYKKTDETHNITLHFYARHFLIFVLVSLTSILLSTLKVGIGFGLPGFVYTILGPLCYWHAVRFGKKYGELNTTQ